MHSLEELLRSAFLVLVPFLIAFALAYAFGPPRLWQGLIASVIVLLVVIFIAARAGMEQQGP